MFIALVLSKGANGASASIAQVSFDEGGEEGVHFYLFLEGNRSASAWLAGDLCLEELVKSVNFKQFSTDCSALGLRAVFPVGLNQEPRSGSRSSFSNSLPWRCCGGSPRPCSRVMFES